MNHTPLSKEDVMTLDLLKRVKKSKDTLMEESKKKDFIREVQLENVNSEKRKFLVKLLVQNTELKLACREEESNVNYIIEKFFQTSKNSGHITRTVLQENPSIPNNKFPLQPTCKKVSENSKYTNGTSYSLSIPDDEFLSQEITTFQQRLGRIARLKEKVKIDKGEVANELLKTQTSDRMSVILRTLSTLLYETNKKITEKTHPQNTTLKEWKCSRVKIVKVESETEKSLTNFGKEKH